MGTCNMITKNPEIESEPDHTLPTRHIIESLEIPDSLSRGIYDGACESEDETFVQKVSPCGCEANISVDNEDYLTVSSESNTDIEHHKCQKPSINCPTYIDQSTSHENLHNNKPTEDCSSKIVTLISINEIANATVQNPSKCSFQLKGDNINTSCKSCQASINIQCPEVLQEPKNENTKPECSPKCSASLHLQAGCCSNIPLKPIQPTETPSSRSKSKNSIEIAVQPLTESRSQILVSISKDTAKTPESVNQPPSADKPNEVHHMTETNNVEVIPTPGSITDTTKPLQDANKLLKGVCAKKKQKCKMDAKDNSCLNEDCPSNKKQCLCRYPPAYSQYLGSCAGAITGNCNCARK